MTRGPTWRKGQANQAKVGMGTHPFERQFSPPFLECEDHSTLSHCGAVIRREKGIHPRGRPQG
jgi:hypothetical protein